MTYSAESDAALHPCAVRCQHAAALGAPEWASCADGVDRCSYYGVIPPAETTEGPQ